MKDGTSPHNGGRRFTAERRERFLQLVEQGITQGEACREVGVGQQTVRRWRLDGREGRSPEAVEFSSRLDSIGDGTSEVPLDVRDLVRLLERSARKGSVNAQKYLLERLERLQAEAKADGSESEPSFAELIDEIRERNTKRRRLVSDN